MGVVQRQCHKIPFSQNSTRPGPSFDSTSLILIFTISTVTFCPYDSFPWNSTGVLWNKGIFLGVHTRKYNIKHQPYLHLNYCYCHLSFKGLMVLFINLIINIFGFSFAVEKILPTNLNFTFQINLSTFLYAKTNLKFWLNLVLCEMWFFFRCLHYIMIMSNY